jgi:N-methylhydantoinase A
MGRLAIDIGGTFTDLAYFDEETGNLTVEKVLTTTEDLTKGIQAVIRSAKLNPNDVGYFVHGGTTVINAITERKGAKTALITTRGFRDVLEIGRGNRPDLYNLRFSKPTPFVPRHLRFEIQERIAADGTEIEPLDLDSLEEIVLLCRKLEVEAIAIQLLHSYVSPQHEIDAADFLRFSLPGVAITASSQITREWREYERANTAVLNAYVQPIVHRYFDRLENSLIDQNIKCPLHAMQSNGGTTNFSSVREHPITLIESGPSAGVNGAAIVAKLYGEDNVIYLDIGGTTAKCSVVEDAQPKVTTEYKLESSRLSSGYPIKVPVVDIVEIGTGGGSIAWVDPAGNLKVGPSSAGSSPGPACYDLGGDQPTVTDAKLITGILDPNYFSGGRIKLVTTKAHLAMESISKLLFCSIEDAAVAVIQIADADMINALKLVSIQRGYDPREFVLLVGGGGGAMHAATLGRELGVRKIIIPRYPGYFSAWGMLTTAPRRDFVRTFLCGDEDINVEIITDLFKGLQTEAEVYFRPRESDSTYLLHYIFAIDLRYLGQEHSVTVPINLDEISVEEILTKFHSYHKRTYTFSLENTQIEFVSFRLTAIAKTEAPELKPIKPTGRPLKSALKGCRYVYYGDDGKHQAMVYDRNLLPPDVMLKGPVIIEEQSATTAVHPNQILQVDTFGSLHIEEA